MPKTFVQVIGEFAEGRTNDELTAALAMLVQSVIACQKKGTLTLKIAVEPNGENTVRLVDSIEAKVPQKARGASIFFAGEDGSLLKRDPRQKELELRSVGTRPAGPPRRVATSTSIGGAQAQAIAEHLEAEDEREERQAAE